VWRELCYKRLRPLGSGPNRRGSGPGHGCGLAPGSLLLWCPHRADALNSAGIAQRLGSERPFPPLRSPCGATLCAGLWPNSLDLAHLLFVVSVCLVSDLRCRWAQTGFDDLTSSEDVSRVSPGSCPILQILASLARAPLQWQEYCTACTQRVSAEKHLCSTAT